MGRIFWPSTTATTNGVEQSCVDLDPSTYFYTPFAIISPFLIVTLLIVDSWETDVLMKSFLLQVIDSA